MLKFLNKDLIHTTVESKYNSNQTITHFNSIGVGQNQKQIRLASVISDTQNYSDNNLRIWMSNNSEGKSVFKMNSSAKNRFDTDVYIVAIPFNGILKPIESSFEYRIFRGSIIQSERRDIEYDDALFKKIAYMVIVPNVSLFNKTHKYHKDVLTLKIESYNIEGYNEDKHTVCTEHTIEFTEEGIVYLKKRSDCSDVDVAEFKGAQTFPIYTVKDKKEKLTEKPNKMEYQKPEVSDKPPVNNKHNPTIGEEIPCDNYVTQDSLDDMIEKMNSDYKSKYPAKKHGKKGKNKKRR